jgi:predicted solute-binding protein
MKLTLGFSPCPNDTFMFDALVHQKVDTEGLEFDVVLEDVETLNRMALERQSCPSMRFYTPVQIIFYCKAVQHWV